MYQNFPDAPLPALSSFLLSLWILQQISVMRKQRLFASQALEAARVPVPALGLGSRPGHVCVCDRAATRGQCQTTPLPHPSMLYVRTTSM